MHCGVLCVFLWLIFYLPTSALPSPVCRRSVSCDFDDAANAMCGFSLGSGYNRNQWERHNQTYGMPDGQGYYVYVLQGSEDQTHNADLTSPPLCAGASVTVSFDYVLTKLDSELHIITQCHGNESDQRSYDYVYSLRKKWSQSSITLKACSDSDTTMIFRGIMPQFGGTASIALDKITIASAPPSPECLRSVSCDFDDAAKASCGLSLGSGSKHNQWMRSNHVYGIPDVQGYYVHVLRVIKDQTHNADLTSPPLCAGASVTVSFDYVLTKQGSELHIITQCQGHESDQRSYDYVYSLRKEWSQSSITLKACSDSDTTIIFQGTMPKYEGTASIALDNIEIALLPPPTTTTTTATTTPTITATTTELKPTEPTTTEPVKTEQPSTSTTTITKTTTTSPTPTMESTITASTTESTTSTTTSEATTAKVTTTSRSTTPPPKPTTTSKSTPPKTTLQPKSSATSTTSTSITSQRPPTSTTPAASTQTGRATPRYTSTMTKPKAEKNEGDESQRTYIIVGVILGVVVIIIVIVVGVIAARRRSGATSGVEMAMDNINFDPTRDKDTTSLA